MMVARNTRTAAGRPGNRTRPAAAPAEETPVRRKPAGNRASAAPARKTAATPARRTGPDVTAYATKPPTGYHKAFARWIVQEVGYDPSQASSARQAFLMGVAIATAARPAFNASDAVEEYREKSGEAKRGPKPGTAKAAAPTRKGRAAAPVADDDDFDEDDDEFADDSEETEEDDFDESDDEDSDDDEEDDFDEEEEEAPPAKRAPARSKPAAARKATPAAKSRRTPAAAPSDDDDFVF